MKHRDLLNSHPVAFRFAQELGHRFAGKTLVDLYSTSPEQIVFEFADESDSFYFIFWYSSQKTFYYIRENFGKPKSKYNTLFRALHGRDVVAVKAYDKERSLGFYLNDGSVLLLALFGVRSFLLHQEAGLAESLKINAGGRDTELHPAEKMSIEPEFLAKLFKETEVPDVQQADYIILADAQKHVRLDFVADGEVLLKTSNLEEALHAYARQWFSLHGKTLLTNKLEVHLNGAIKKLEKSIKAAETHLARIENELDYKGWADLLMAYLYQVKPDADQVELQDFYSDKLIKIPLNKKLNPQQNAERYYRKAKNQGKETEVLQSTIQNHKAKLNLLATQLGQLAKAEDIKALQELEKEVFGTKAEQKKEKESKFNEFEVLGFKIYVGRNSKNNDELTLHFAQKNDLWLHAKDLAGSHVLIRNQGADMRYPKNVIEKAAEIAAYYSKGRNQNTCPVIYTPKKYIRKPKGAPAGAVLVEREDVIFVQPALPA